MVPGTNSGGNDPGTTRQCSHRGQHGTHGPSTMASSMSLKETEERKGGGSIKDHRVSAACLKEPRSFSQEKRRLREPRTGVLLAFSISTENTGIQGGWTYFLGSY